MGSHIDRDFHQGLVVMDPRFSTAKLSTTLSSYTQSGPSPEQPVAQDRTGYMQPEALGTLTSEQNIELRCQKEGAPVGANRGGRYAKRAQGDPDWDGHLNYNKVTGFEIIDLVTDPTAGHTTPDTLSLQSGDLLTVSINFVNVSDVRVETRRRNPDTNTWSSPVTVRALQSVAAIAPAALVQLPNGRIYCYYFRQLLENSTNYWTLSFSYSDDDGDTWTVAGNELAGFKEDSTTFSPRKLRVVYHQAYVTMVIMNGTGAIPQTVHLASADLGSSFTEIEAFNGQQGDPVVDNAGRVWLIYTDSSGSEIKYSRKGAPFAKFADDPSHGSTLSSTAVDVAGGSCLASVVDDVGYVWVFARAQAGGVITRGMLYGYRFDLTELGASRDRWNSDGIGGSLHPIDTGDTDFRLLEFDAAPHSGSILLVTNWGVPSGASGSGNSLTAVRLGGWSSVDWPVQTFGYKTGAPPGSSGHAWFGIEKPSTITGITPTQSGTYTETVTTDGVELETINGQTFYTWTGLAAGNPCLHQLVVMLDTFGTVGAIQVGIEGTWGDSTNKTTWEIRLSKTGFRLRDIGGSSVLNTLSGSTTQAADLSTPLEFLIYHNESVLIVRYRALGSTKWTVSHNTSALGLVPSTDACKFVWGHILPGSSQRSTWRWLGSAMDAIAHDPDLAAFSNPADLEGKETGLFRQWIQNGFQVRFKGSSGHFGDTFSAGTRFEGAIGNLDPSRSPDGLEAWISESDQVEQRIAWEPEDGMDSRVPSPTIGIYLDCNFRTAFFEAYNGSSWTTLATIDGSTNIMPTTGATVFPYTLTGNVLKAAGSSDPGGQFVGMDERVSVVLSDGANSAAFNPSKVKAGVWGPDKPALQMLLEDNTAGDLAAGTVGTPQSAQVYAQRHLTLIHNVTTEYEAFRLRVPAQRTPEGQHMVRRCMVGGFDPVGMSWSWGRRHRRQLNRETFEAESGARRHRKRGPSRDSVEVAWPDGWDMTQVQGANPEPDYIAPHSSSAEAYGASQDGSMVEQVMERTEGGVLPVVWCAAAAPATSSAVEAVTLTSPHQYLFGTISDAVTRQVLVGDEFKDEVVSVSALVITEEV